MDRFSALPDEILDLISGEVQDYRSLFYLSLVSKNCYHVFSPRLYESVKSGDRQLGTVASLENERVPLTGPHPASFVKNLELEFCPFYPLNPNPDLETKKWQEEETVRTNLFKKRAESALNNITKHAVLRRLQLLGIHLDEVLGKVNSTKFGHLRQLVIKNPILEHQSLDIFESLCSSSPTLNYLTLNWRVFEDTSDATARLLEVIPKACPNLQTIHIHLTDEDESCKRLQRVLDDPNFTFPLLDDCRCHDFMQCNASKFLERHPKIEKLQVSMISMGGLGLLPNLRHFHGYALDYLKLCTNRPPPVQCLEINLHRLSEEEELCLVNGLANTKTLTQLALTDYLKSTVSLVFLASITKACPELTHFKCALGNEKSMDLIYSTIFRSLPNLEHLRLQFEYASDPDVEILYSSHLQGLASRHPLKTLQIDILIDSVEQTKWEFFYFMKDNNRIIPAPKLDANRFDWF